MVLKLFHLLFSSLLLLLSKVSTASFHAPMVAVTCPNNKKTRKKSIYTLPPTSLRSSSLCTRSSSSSSLSSLSLDSLITEQSASLLIAESNESWRQYVPLVVSFGVILDILLGSPLANLALG
jgi:hypothetical protein